MNCKSFLLFLLILSMNFYAQKTNYASIVVPQNLLEHANSVLLFNDVNAVIESQKSMVVKTTKVVRLLNELGIRNIDASEYYDKSTKIKQIEAKIYNAAGKVLKSFNNSDFIDTSVADGFSIITDGRNKYMDLTPTEYPLTVVYESTVETSNTAFIAPWYAINDYQESVLKSHFSITFPEELGFKYKEKNFLGFNIVKTESKTNLSYTCENIEAISREDLAPSHSKLFPNVIFGLNKFSLEGVLGQATTWQEYGLWMENKLLFDTKEISEESKQKLIAFVGDAKDPIEKAKKVYEYLQSKSRYVSIQLGIGGWKPMLAKDVDRLGYGDCKALSNYTKSMLNVVGVPSYYAIIYGGNEKRNIDPDFVSLQGNHAVLAIPTKEKLVFLECTSQTAPFGFEGDFTDDRTALVITPEGGKIVKTTTFTDVENFMETKASYNFDDQGNIIGKATIETKGLEYDEHYPKQLLAPDKIKEYFAHSFLTVANIKIDKPEFLNDKNKLTLKESFGFSGQNFGSKTGESYIFAPNVIDQLQYISQRHRSRKAGFEIQRGYKNIDEIEVNFPAEYIIEAKQEVIAFKDKFGEYRSEIIYTTGNKFVYKRSVLIKSGSFDKLDYENYRKFREQIARADNTKLVIKKK
jgi:hypothetical protein